MPKLLNIMKSLAFVCAVLFFITSHTILGHADVHDDESYWDPVAVDVQPREYHVESWTSQPVSSPGCPENCSCVMNVTQHIVTVDCSNAGLNAGFKAPALPDFPHSAVKLLLSNNSFSLSTRYCEAFQGLWSLEDVDLSHNLIYTISDCVFQSQTDSLRTLNVSFNEIILLPRETFQNLSRLEVLDLSHNQIPSLGPKAFADLAQLIHLNLSFNYIEYIEPDAFKGLHLLKTLRLQNNLMEYDYALHRDVFQDLGALEILNVKSNNGVAVILDDAVSPLKNLSELYMDISAGYTKLGEGFRNLTNLRLLDLSSTIYNHGENWLYKDESYSEIGTVPSDFFENIQTEKNLTLFMVGCFIHEIGNSTFLSLPTLVNLNLSNNHDLNFGVECGDWLDSLPSTTITNLDLSGTTAKYHNEFSGRCLDSLAETNIKTLNLGMNRIYVMHNVRPFPITVEKLIVSENCISLYFLYVLYVEYGYRDLKLRELHANDQYLDDLIVRFNMPPPDSGSIIYIEPPNAFSHKTCPIDLKSQYPDMEVICLPPDLTVIYGNSALRPLRTTVGHIRILNNLVLSHVELADNVLTNLIGPIENVPSLKVLDLSRNQCTRLDFTFFKYMFNLETLILKENFLSVSISTDDKGLTFSTLPNLRMLDLSQNFITDLSSQAFIHNTNLETLDLSYNRLSRFQPSISTVNKMSFLNLSINLLSGLSEQTCDELKVLKSRNENFTISLLDNPLLFTCDYLPFLDLVISNPHIFFGVEHMQFKYANGTNLYYKDLAPHLPSFARECLIQRLFDVVLITFFVLVGTVSICAVIYHKRWKLRYLYYIGQRRMHIGEHIVDYHPDADIFITYDQDDLRWRRFMQRTFLPGLNQRNITYILGETDFPGGDLMAHVAGAVVGTRKTVVLLSEEIFDDHHREFEMNLAIMREMDTRSLKIVPVFVEDVDLVLYPREIELFLRNQWHRCLSYDDCDFWDGFVDAVREDN